jgi:hypothetical protein
MSREDFEPLAWAAKGIPRAEAERWYRDGLSLADALRWRESFEVDEALAWRRAGVTSPGEARSWRVAGVTASAVGGWRAARIGFAEAAAWREFDYSLEEAKKLKAEGKSPSESFRQRVQLMQSQPSPATGRGWFGRVGGGKSRTDVHRFLERLGRRQSPVVHSYMFRQWFDDEAVAWAEQDIDAGEALAWKELGLKPAEARPLVKEGATAASTMRVWWQAGIPFEEVAAWLGAGLTPEEAAAQRAKGIDADRAAVLRALRDPDEPTPGE